MTKAEERREQRIGLMEREHFVPCWDGIVKALERIPHFWEYHTPEWAFDAAIRGTLQVWAVGDDRGIDLFILTMIVEYPRCRVLRLLGASGEGLDSHLSRLQDVFEKYAEIQKCEKIEIIGRFGWARKFKKLWGTSFDCVVMTRPVASRRSH
jgi:hypothetical protein